MQPSKAVHLHVGLVSVMLQYVMSGPWTRVRGSDVSGRWMARGVWHTERMYGGTTNRPMNR
jgi:hypothetical protein